jgi:hypothetical protein
MVHLPSTGRRRASEALTAATALFELVCSGADPFANGGATQLHRTSRKIIEHADGFGGKRFAVDIEDLIHVSILDASKVN